MKAKKNSTTSGKKPHAWIVNPKDRGRKSIKKDNSIYLQDGQNFEIELFNPLPDSVLAEIKVNGKSVTSTGLIIRPGERFYLDCFVDDKKKFVFKTYMVEDTDELKTATAKNGLVEVFFYKEETVRLNNWRDITTIIERRYYPYYYPWYPSSNPFWYTYTTNGTSLNSNLSTYTVNNNQLSQNAQNLMSQGLASNYTFQSNGLTGTTTGAFYCSTNDSSSVNINLTSTPSFTNISSIETGRIEKGEQSQQQFEEVDMQFESYHISNVVYKLLPESQKPIETKEIKEITAKKFCEQCGFKLNGNEKFCPDCGNKL